MRTFFHHPTAPERQENLGQPRPDGWTGPHSEAESAAWVAAWQARLAAPIPVAPTYTRADYKAALDAMLQAQCTGPGYEFDDIISAASWTLRPGPFNAIANWLLDLRDFTWVTSDQMAKAAAQAGDAPTTPPEQFAAYILSLFEASNPRPA